MKRRKTKPMTPSYACAEQNVDGFEMKMTVREHCHNKRCSQLESKALSIRYVAVLQLPPG